MSELAVAEILDQYEALRIPAAHCKKCHTELLSTNRAHWVGDGDMCRDCAAKLGGVRVDEATFMLLTRGYIIIAYYGNDDSWRLRLEMRSGSHVDCLCLKSTFGGNVNQHGPGMWKWTVGSVEMLDKMGRIIMKYVPELGMVLQKYVAQPNFPRRSTYAEALAAYLGTRAIAFVRFVDVDD